MSSIDKSRIIGAKDEDLVEFTCGICLGIFTEPVVTLCCSQIYCKPCILTWLSNESTCPNDRIFIRSVDLVSAPRPLLNLVENLKVKCVYDQKGCNQVIRIGDLTHHRNNCEFRPDKPCSVCGLIKEMETDHDCLTGLIAENKKLQELNKKLVDENRVLMNNRNNIDLWALFESRPTLKHILLILMVLVLLFSGIFSSNRNNGYHYIDL